MCCFVRARREKDEGRDEKRRGEVRKEEVMKWYEGEWEVTLITETCDLHTITLYKTTDPLLRWDQN